MVTEQQLQDWENAERAKDVRDPRVLALIEQVRELQGIIERACPSVECLVQRYAGAVRDHAESELRGMRLSDALSRQHAPGRN